MIEPGVVDGLVTKLDALRYHTLVSVDDDEVERVACEAADALLALKAEVEELRGALEPFARGPDGTSLAKLYAHLTREHYHRARAILSGESVK